jgi:hypothetical protein
MHGLQKQNDIGHSSVFVVHALTLQALDTLELPETEMNCSVEEECKVKQVLPGSGHFVQQNCSTSHIVEIDGDQANQPLHLGTLC